MPNFYKGPTGRFVSNHRDRVGVQFRRLYTTDMISSDEDRKMFGMCVDSFSFKHRINNHHLKRDDKISKILLSKEFQQKLNMIPCDGIISSYERFKCDGNAVTTVNIFYFNNEFYEANLCKKCIARLKKIEGARFSFVKKNPFTKGISLGKGTRHV